MEMANLTTKLYNGSEWAMVMETKDQYDMIREIRRIEAGKQVYVSYKDGFVSCNPNLEISYFMYPDNHKGRTVGKTFHPFHVFYNSEIRISYDNKVVLTYVRAQGFLHRMGISRWFKDLFFR